MTTLLSHEITGLFIEQDKRTFLSITANQTECTIIADQDSLHDLAERVREDRQGQPHLDTRAPIQDDYLEVSDDCWSVFVLQTGAAVGEGLLLRFDVTFTTSSTNAACGRMQATRVSVSGNYPSHWPRLELVFSGSHPTWPTTSL